MAERYDCIIIGAGPAGLAAGLYAARDRFKTLLLEKFAPGGQINNTDRIENYPGFERISGYDLIEKMQGRVIVTGMGKSGHIARKLAATLASTGTPAMFVHAAEASHGDLGMITASDVVIALSNSGETAELADVLVYAKRFDIPL